MIEFLMAMAFAGFVGWLSYRKGYDKGFGDGWYHHQTASLRMTVGEVK